MKKIFLTIVILYSTLQLFAQGKTYPTSITVAQDGSGDFLTIQAAVNSTRDLRTERVVITIKKGVYREKLVIPSWKTNISLIGEEVNSTIITNSDFSGKDNAGGKDIFGNEKFSTFTSYTMLVQGNDFRAENLTIENSAGRVGQAVALHVEGDRCVFKNCKFLGNQDTLYVATEKSRQLYQNCYIEGTTDFIFGEATVVFEKCTIKSLSNSFVTAAATTPRQAFGFVFFDCKLIADSAASKVYLGRPWRPYAKTAFIRCDLGPHIVPEGWDPWKGDAMFPDKEKTTTYLEFGNVGSGADPARRVIWARQLTTKEVKKFTIQNILVGSDHWNPLN